MEGKGGVRWLDGLSGLVDLVLLTPPSLLVRVGICPGEKEVEVNSNFIYPGLWN